MDFELTDDRRMLADTLNRFLADKLRLETRNKVAYEAPYHDSGEVGGAGRAWRALRPGARGEGRLRRRGLRHRRWCSRRWAGRSAPSRCCRSLHGCAAPRRGGCRPGAAAVRRHALRGGHGRGRRALRPGRDRDRGAAGGRRLDARRPQERRLRRPRRRALPRGGAQRRAASRCSRWRPACAQVTTTA